MSVAINLVWKRSALSCIECVCVVCSKYKIYKFELSYKINEKGHLSVFKESRVSSHLPSSFLKSPHLNVKSKVLRFKSNFFANVLTNILKHMCLYKYLIIIFTVVCYSIYV